MTTQKLANHAIWLSNTSQNNGWGNVLHHTKSLTQYLIDLAHIHNGSKKDFCVQVLRQYTGLAQTHEYKKIALDASNEVNIREVHLCLFSTPVVFARSIIPVTLTQEKQTLHNLGNTPLGHFLFDQGQIKIAQRQFAEINNKTHTIYARRTPYCYQQHTILVAEFFLPTLQKYLITSS